METQIPFNNMGLLPVPCDWMLQPHIKTLALEHHKAKKPNVIYVMDEKKPRQRTWYSFRIVGVKPQVRNQQKLERNCWIDWHATGSEDLENGHAWISATYHDFDDPDFSGVSSRVTWQVQFNHDGTPERYRGDPNGEFWGWIVIKVSVMHTYERTPRNKDPITYTYTCRNIRGEKVSFNMTGNGYFDCQKKAEEKVNSDPILRKVHYKNDPIEWNKKEKWEKDHYFDRIQIVLDEKEET